MDYAEPRKKWLISAVLVLTAVLALTPAVNQKATTDYELLFERAFVTFALARTLNGVISAVQGTEIALQPAGVGITLTPGEILDPVNDLVERFSWIMLGATISLGIQNVLLDVSAWWVIKALLVALAAWLLWHVWLPAQRPASYRGVISHVFVILVFIRFAVPVMLIANDLLYQQFLEPRYQVSTEVITEAGKDLEELRAEATLDHEGNQDSSVFGSISNAWTNTVEAMDLTGRFDRMQARAGEVTEHLIQLSVVFILQTGLLPIAFLWVFLQIFKFLFRSIRVNEAHRPE